MRNLAKKISLKTINQPFFFHEYQGFFLKDSDFFSKGMILSKNVKVLKNVLEHGLPPCGETVLNHVEVELIPVRY